MTLNPQALTEAARALCKCEYPDMADSWHDIAAPDFAESATLVVTAYLAALPPISEETLTDEMIEAGAEAYHEARIAAVAARKARGLADNEARANFPNDWIVQVWRAMAAANTIERLSRELAEAREENP